jgi:hypothetical protein
MPTSPKAAASVASLQPEGSKDLDLVVTALPKLDRQHSLLQDGVLREMVCPLTMEIMVDPCILAEDGHVYERSAVKHALEAMPGRSPMTRQPIESMTLIANRALRNLIEEFIAQGKIPADIAGDWHDRTATVAQQPGARENVEIMGGTLAASSRTSPARENRMLCEAATETQLGQLWTLMREFHQGMEDRVLRDGLSLSKPGTLSGLYDSLMGYVSHIQSSACPGVNYTHVAALALTKGPQRCCAHWAALLRHVESQMTAAGAQDPVWLRVRRADFLSSLRTHDNGNHEWLDETRLSLV